MDKKDLMKKFEIMINTTDKKLANELISPEASFYTPASSSSLFGGEGYLSVVYWMRCGFSDVQWKLEDIVTESNIAAKGMIGILRQIGAMSF